MGKYLLKKGNIRENKKCRKELIIFADLFPFEFFKHYGKGERAGNQNFLLFPHNSILLAKTNHTGLSYVYHDVKKFFTQTSLKVCCPG